MKVARVEINLNIVNNSFFILTYRFSKIKRKWSIHVIGKHKTNILFFPSRM